MELAGYTLEPLRVDGDFALYRGGRLGSGDPILVLAPSRERQTLADVQRLECEMSFARDLDPAWAVRPMRLIRHEQRVVLVLEDPGGDPLDAILGRPLEPKNFLRLAIALTVALRHLHERGLIHRDIKPANVLWNPEGCARLMGFGFASRVPREQRTPMAPETIAGTFAYMAPEQTGRMNRSIDARSDLYALGVTFYEMLAGTLPFTAADPMEWIHCHIARPPQPPSERVGGIPAAIEAIVLKLLAKTAEDRYQTAAGVEADLRLCAASLEASGSIGQFALGARDVPDRLLVPEKLYGREAEIDRLVAAFERVMARGRTELVLVSGYSGVGKSSVVNELHKALVPPRGLFAAGKFDQYKRDIPYATLAQAFQSLVRRILGRDDAELDRWRRALLKALGPNGQLMINLIPELAAVIGDQPSVPELPPQDAQDRFQMVFRQFLGAFARPEHPLALFLDDLQWLDLATLDLLERLVSEGDVRHLLLVGAYRDNEVGPSHPLLRTLKAMRGAGGSLEEIVLAPLALDDIGRLIADTLRTGRGEVRPLAELVFAKTAGNPFFAIQFITSLAEEKLLAFDPSASSWTWDLARIRAKGFTDNVADLMAAKLARLPAPTRQALGLLACLGNVAEIATLDKVHDDADRDVHAALWQAVLAGLVLRTDGAYAFAHDRVHEAAHALVPGNERAKAHLRIGRLLASQTAPEAFEENIFDIVNQLDRGAGLIAERQEREQVAGFNLIAGKRAKTATAYASALQYFAAGRALLGESSWEDSYRLAFDIELNLGECEYLTAELVLADARLSALSTRARTVVDSGAVARLRLNLYTNLDKSVRAIAVGLDFLRQFGVEWSLHPTEADVHRELAAMRRLLAGRPIEQILDLPPMDDPDRLAAMDVLAELLPPARFTDNNLHDLLLLRMTNMSLEHGNCAASCHAYAVLNIVLGLRFGDYQTGFRFSELACDLVDRPGLDRFKARVYMGFGSIALPWTKHLPLGRALIRQAFDTANTQGDRSYAVYSSKNLVTNLLISGEPLEKVQLEAEQAHAFARKARFGLYVDAASEHLMLVRRLRGLEPDAARPAGAVRDEVRFERHLEEGGERLALVAAWYWIHRMQGDVFAGDSAAATRAALKAGDLLWATKSHLEFGEYHFYGALTRAAACSAASGDLREQHLSALFGHREAIAAWARNCPENFANRLALVDAEIARIEGREIDAASLYEEAIRSARAFGFVQNEALGYELAAQFYAARGLQMICDACLRSARDGYLRWGANGKVRQLERANPHLRQGARPASSASIPGTPVENLDLATVVKVSQAVSGEIDLKKLIDTLMIIALEHAGGDRGLLILPQGDELWIEAQAKAGNESVEVQIRRSRATGQDLPHSVLNYVVRSLDHVLLADVSDPSPFSEDEYIVRNRCRSLLCLPLLKQSRLVGVLYIENSQTPHVFTPARMAVLSLLASQAAISLENADLYADLKRTEAYLAEAQRLSRMGSWVWDLATGRTQLSDEHLRMFGFTSEQRDSSYELALDKLHPEDRPRVRSVVDAAIRAREDFNCEFRIVMADGTIEHMHARGRHVVNEVSGADEYVGTIVDITERKRHEDNMQKLVSLIENSTDFIGYAPTPGNTGYLNAAGRRLVGLGMNEDISNYQVGDFLSPESNRIFVQDVLPVLARVGHWEGELSLRHFKNNSLIPVHQSVSFITQKGSDQPIGIATISRDVTERKRADENLKASLEEKEVLLKEVHHRVKNNLQLISSLLNLQAARIADPMVAEQFADSRNRVRSMALVHENLYRAGNFARVPMRAHIQSLCAHLIRAYGLHSQHVGLANDIDEIELDLDRAISTGLIVNELVSNAFKHAFPDGRPGGIRVELKLVEGTRCALTVADDGVGLRADLAVGQTGTMGFQLVHDLAHQLYGVLSVKHEGGTTFRIVFDTRSTKEEMQ